MINLCEHNRVKSLSLYDYSNLHMKEQSPHFVASIHLKKYDNMQFVSRAIIIKHECIYTVDLYYATLRIDGVGTT